MTIADRISELRRSRAMSQEELAELAGVSRQAVSKWESEQSIPDMYNVVTLSEIFGVTTDYLLRGVEPIGEYPETKKRPSAPYNIVATALNVIGLMVSCGIFAITADEVSSLVCFVFMTLGVMTFMLGTVKLPRRDQLTNACSFWRVNIWVVLFFAMSLIYNAALKLYISPFPQLLPTTYMSLSTTKDPVLILIGRGEVDEVTRDFIVYTAPVIFVVAYTLLCAVATYLFSLAIHKAKLGEPLFRRPDLPKPIPPAEQ